MSLLAGLLFVAPAHPQADREVAGFRLPVTLRLDPEGVTLRLNGAHVRHSLLREVTLFAIYAAEPARSFDALLAVRAPIRVAVTILREEFTAERFRKGWREQFEQVLTQEQRQPLAPQIEQFLANFVTLRRGDQILFDFVPGAGVRMRVRGEPKTTIAGDAFSEALLGVWLGPRSVDPGLRQALLAGG